MRRPEAAGRGAVPGAGPGTIPGLDGVRALAVGLVFFAHSGLENIVPGGLGVTMFFVLSGYLISTLLRQEQARSGSVHLRNFYLRRCLRLMPPLLVVVAAAAALSALGLIDGRFSRQGLVAVLCYYGNYHVIFHDFGGVPAGVGVVWSLAVEEHYYLLYPPLVWLALRGGHQRIGAALLALACALVLARRWWLLGHGASEAYIGMATDTRIDAILVGCLLGWLCNPWLDRVPAPAPLRERGCQWLCLGLLAASLLLRDPLFRAGLRYTVQSLAFAALLYYAVARHRQRPFRWLQAAPLAYLGRVSYTIYLVHHLVLAAVERHCPGLGWAGRVALTAALTLGIAEAMRRWVEQPCQGLRQALRRTPPRAAAPAPAGAPAPL